MSTAGCSSSSHHPVSTVGFLLSNVNCLDSIVNCCMSAVECRLPHVRGHLSGSERPSTLGYFLCLSERLSNIGYHLMSLDTVGYSLTHKVSLIKCPVVHPSPASTVTCWSQRLVNCHTFTEPLAIHCTKCRSLLSILCHYPFRSLPAVRSQLSPHAHCHPLYTLGAYLQQ